MRQSKRIEIAKSTLEILEKGFYINQSGNKVQIKDLQQNAEQSTRSFTPDELTAILGGITQANNFSTQYEVTTETTLDAARRLSADGEKNVMCLNFASAKNPGGGFLGGALAQEECIARASGLYPCLLKAQAYYKYHRSLNTCLYSDHMIYSPEVPVIKDENGELLEEAVCITIITSPAVNAGVIKQNESNEIDKIKPVMKHRMEKLLALCRHYHHETIILGAWGCGVFQNDPEDIAQLFLEGLTGRFNNHFRKVVFAIKTNKEQIIEPFRKRFAG